MTGVTLPDDLVVRAESFYRDDWGSLDNQKWLARETAAETT